MYARNSRGPSTVPWGTPEVTGAELDDLPSTKILLMKLQSHQIMLIYMNKALKLLNHLSSEFHHS